MKKIYTLIMAAAIAASALPSCKKGENDPFLSLRTRKARVAGEWKVTSGKGSNTQTGAWNPYTSSWTYDGSTQSETEGGNTTSFPRTITYSFEKDGTYTHTDISDGATVTTTGTWNFLQGVGETKNKSRLALNELTTTSQNGPVTTEGEGYDMMYTIDELRHKKMVLKLDFSYAYSDGSGGSFSEELVLEPK